MAAAAVFSQWSVRGGRKWTAQRTALAGLLMSWDEASQLTERFRNSCECLQRLFPRWRLGTSYSGFCTQQQAWSPKVLPAVMARLRTQMQAMAGVHWRREGWVAFAADGSRVECPRTEANEQELGCAGRTRTTPQLMLTTLYHMGTGLPWSFRVGPGTESERRQLDEMVDELPAEALLVTDAGFASYDLCETLIETGRHFLLRVGGNFHLLTDLGYARETRGDTVSLWPDRHQKEGLPPLTLRLIVLGEAGKKIYLITDVLEHESLSDEQAGRLYRMRWGVEVFYRSYKRTVGHHKMKSRTPATCEAELHWTLIGVWLMGLMTVCRIIEAGNDPLAWSVAASRTCLRRAMRGVCHRSRHDDPLAAQLAQALTDTYTRSSRKKARDWPHKKRERPPGPPKIRPAKTEEVQRAKQLTNKKLAA